jgi:hypothetical protein
MATVKFRLNHEKENENNKDEPLSIMVIYYSSVTGQIELATGEKAPINKWNGSRVKSPFKNYQEINKHLIRIEEGLLDLWRTNKSAGKQELKALIKEVVKGGGVEPQKKTVLDVLQDFIKVYSSEKTEGTVKRYKSLRSKLLEFKDIPYNPRDEMSKGWPITLDMLDFNFYDRFKRFLYDTPNPLYKGYSLHRVKHEKHEVYDVVMDEDDKPKGLPVGLFDTVVYKYFVNIKTILTWGEKKRICY